MLAEKYEEDGTKVSAEVQSKGYVSTDYKVSTQYQVTLYRWNMAVRGSPGTMSWDFTLENADREEQNAYHEYFIVMQVDEGEAFTIDKLDLGGELNGWWWGDYTTLGVGLENVTLLRPDWEPAGETDADTDADTDTDTDSDTEESGLEEWDTGSDGDEEGDTNITLFSCSSTDSAPLNSWWLGLVGLVGLGWQRRR